MSPREASTFKATSLGEALLRWINTVSSTTTITSLVDLNDGIVLWQVLQTIAPNHFTTCLPHIDAVDVEMRWQNCKLLLIFL